jgi:hypothetical protein
MRRENCPRKSAKEREREKKEINRMGRIDRMESLIQVQQPDNILFILSILFEFFFASFREQNFLTAEI